MANKKARLVRAPQKPAARGRYHHGDLRSALIAAAEQLLTEQGIERFSLRAAARRAAVSPAAPAYHFGDAAGLLTEVAILGFEELNRYLAEWTEKGGANPLVRLRSQGEGYIRFALANRARFQLMFRKDKLGASERLATISMETFSQLKTAVCHVADCVENDNDPKITAVILASWSLVHGFAHLALDGQFNRISAGAGLNDFLDAYVPLVLGQLGAPPNPPVSGSPG